MPISLPKAKVIPFVRDYYKLMGIMTIEGTKQPLCSLVTFITSRVGEPIIGIKALVQQIKASQLVGEHANFTGQPDRGSSIIEYFNFIKSPMIMKRPNLESPLKDADMLWLKCVPMLHHSSVEPKVNETEAIVKFQMKKVLCVGIVVENLAMEEKQIFQNVQPSVGRFAILRVPVDGRERKRRVSKQLSEANCVKEREDS
ncbi:hypothetical protein Syun_019404 [Stephania yunnanensis]|uniref:Uncharacterized protein n=1 Tax=Stephania yunnanensis TaxID=152371 RepID=A0AAP0IW28_9MAGN